MIGTLQTAWHGVVERDINGKITVKYIPNAGEASTDPVYNFTYAVVLTNQGDLTTEEFQRIKDAANAKLAQVHLEHILKYMSGADKIDADPPTFDQPAAKA